MSNLELNQGDNFIFGVDVSGSMQQTDCPGGLSRIDFLKEKLVTFAKEAAKYDPDGIDILTFGQVITPYPKVSAERAESIVQLLRANEAATMTHLLIRKAYALHKDGGYQQTVLFVATDGSPTDPSAVKSAIIEVAKDLKDEHEFAISFLTVGNIDPTLRAFLTQLDDDLKGAPYDIVDVKALEEVDFLSAFSGALHD